MSEKLKAVLKEHGLKTDGKVVLTQYHPKRAPRWMRINEVRALGSVRRSSPSLCWQASAESGRLIISMSNDRCFSA